MNSSINIGSLTFTLSDIEDGIRQLKTSTKSDVDGLSSYLLKFCSAIAYPLLLMFNKSLDRGEFIDAWKVTTISPVFKSGNKNNIANYRPIAKLSTVSKLFELIVKDKIYFVVSRYISVDQHGFMKGRSTVSNLAVFSEYCISSFKKKTQVDAVYTDFSKAFDKVNHRVLISKLSAIGFHSTLLKWIKSYLSSRKCVVNVDGVSSISFIASSGVPQGSILGPLLFILFINDISRCFNNANFLLYADDLKIYSRIASTVDSLNLQSDLDNVASWCKRNKLDLNISKCFYISYSKSCSLIPTSYHICGSSLSHRSEITDLGVIFDSKFSFQKHLNHTISKSYSVLAFIRRFSSDFVDPYTLKLLYTSLVRSKLEYAVFIWRPYYACHISRLERVQKAFVRYALRSLNFTDPIPSYKSRCLLINLKSLDIRRTILSITFLFDLINGVIDSPSLLEKINFNIPQRSLRNHDFFWLGMVRTNYASNAPISRTLGDFNSLSSHTSLDFCSTKYHFKLVLNELLN